MKSEAPKLSFKEKPPKDWYNLPHDMCRCSTCGWEGPVAVCDHDEETESWEMSHVRYTVHYCPVCSISGRYGSIDNYWSSIALLFDKAEEECGECS